MVDDDPTVCRLLELRLSSECIGVVIAASGAETERIIGVIHFNSVRERVALTTNYRVTEEKLRIDPLPLVVLSPAGKTISENSLLDGRAYEVLTTPATVSRFLVAAQKFLGAGEPVAHVA